MNYTTEEFKALPPATQILRLADYVNNRINAEGQSLKDVSPILHHIWNIAITQYGDGCHSIYALVTQYVTTPSSEDNKSLTTLRRELEECIKSAAPSNEVETNSFDSEVRFQYLGNPSDVIEGKLKQFLRELKEPLSSAAKIHLETLQHDINEIIRGLLALSTDIPKEWPGVPKHQEPKYTFLNNHFVNRHSGEEIPYEEPIMIFRGRDRVFVELLENYRDKFRVGSSHFTAIDGRVSDFHAFARAYPERMKTPDTWLPGRKDDSVAKTPEDLINAQVNETTALLNQAAGLWHDGFRRDGRIRSSIEDVIGLVLKHDDPTMKSFSDQLEILRMQLVGCGVAASSNTPESRNERFTRSHPYWTASYGDVCDAVDREMKHASELRWLENQSKWGHTVTMLERGEELELVTQDAGNQQVVLRRNVSEKELYNLVRGLALPNGQPIYPLYTEWNPTRQDYVHDVEVYANRVRSENVCGELTNIQYHAGRLIAKWIPYDNDRGRAVNDSLHTLENQSHLQLRIVPRLYQDDDGIIHISCFDVETVEFADDVNSVVG